MSVINFFNGYKFFFMPDGIQKIKRSNALRSEGLYWEIFMFVSLCYCIGCPVMETHSKIIYHEKYFKVSPLS